MQVENQQSSNLHGEAVHVEIKRDHGGIMAICCHPCSDTSRRPEQKVGAICWGGWRILSTAAIRKVAIKSALSVAFTISNSLDS